jgi:hypothetical protein
MFVPETSGLILEDMDAVFAQPWYRIGRHRHSVTRNDPDVVKRDEEKHIIDFTHLETQ